MTQLTLIIVSIVALVLDDPWDLLQGLDTAACAFASAVSLAFLSWRSLHRGGPGGVGFFPSLDSVGVLDADTVVIKIGDCFIKVAAIFLRILQVSS